MCRLRLNHRGLRCALLLATVLLPGLMTWRAQAAPSATVSDCTFTPTQGGPGTLIHAEVFQWFLTPTVEVGFAVPKVPGAPQSGPNLGREENLKPLDKPLAVMRPINGSAETTFRVPARLSSGEALPRQGLYLVCLVDGRIDMGDGEGPAAFTFIPGLPVVGRPLDALWLPLVITGLALILVGVLLSGASRKVSDLPPRRWRKCRHVQRSEQSQLRTVGVSDVRT